ncbi:major facilitator superfamily domain-containing protein [Radiomyces spectabilis]|uniref:major facilitator superfamily domain-containing protein n=1 Tax=Radiomyces spectabilis TaxID=64574 RepID=UPI00221F0C8E|nr:major facilitator superfamily domain-containing protein [Radiomyces spectabilis]KAI8393844.1 major facilitator superfamily domain-containing protein [Radiomyces spectabilis]
MSSLDEERQPLLPSTNNGSGCCATKKSCCASGKGCCSTQMRPQRCNIPTTDDDYCHLADEPWEYKAVALSCALFLAVGSHFAAHTLGATKNILKKEFDISNSQYGVIQSSVSVVNTILPVLGGIFIDAFGTIPGSILTTVLVASGNILVALSISSKNLPMMIIGRVLYGIGSGTVVIVQETILSQWFRGRSLAAVVALMLTVSRLASFLAQATVVPIARWTGWYGYGFWFSAMLCVFSLVVNLVYIILLRRVSNPSVDCQKRVEVIKRKKSFSWSKLLFLPHSYWLIASMEFLLGGAWGCFLHINSEFVKFRFGFDDAHAAATASVAQVLPVALMPILGMCVDRYGKRTWMMIGSGMSLLIAMLLLEFTNIHPILGMLIFSVSLSLGPVGLVSSVPVILPLSLVGTGMGLIKSGTNIGSAIFDITTGLLQDADRNKGYSGVVLFFIAIASLSVLAGVVLSILDHSMYNDILDRSASLAARINKDKTQNAAPTLVKLKSNYFYATLYLSLAAVSWMLFFHFVLF